MVVVVEFAQRIVDFKERIHQDQEHDQFLLMNVTRPKKGLCLIDKSLSLYFTSL